MKTCSCGPSDSCTSCAPPNAIEKARQDIMNYTADPNGESGLLDKLEAAIRADEREQCAKVFDGVAEQAASAIVPGKKPLKKAYVMAKWAAHVIRSREHAKGEGNGTT